LCDAVKAICNTGRCIAVQAMVLSDQQHGWWSSCSNITHWGMGSQFLVCPTAFCETSADRGSPA